MIRPLYWLTSGFLIMAPSIMAYAGLAVDGTPLRVRIDAAKDAGLISPAEGLWSVAMDWREERPVQWYHAHPEEKILEGEWTVLLGHVETPEGVWEVSDRYRSMGALVQGIRRFVWKGDKPAERCSLSIRFQSPVRNRSVLMPGIVYYGNPSGARSGCTPVFTGSPGEGAFYEEHRYPMPFVSQEWNTPQGWRGAALHSLPSPAPFGHLLDQWWSLGAQALEGGLEFSLLSGACASNGQWGVVKGHQPGFVSYPGAYLCVPPGSIIEKTFYLQAYPVSEEGSGFRPAVEASLRLFAPESDRTLPSFDAILRAKYRYANSRWYDDGEAAGFRKYPDKNIFVSGWCGQADALGYALLVLADHLDDSSARDKSQRSLDFLSGAEFYEGGFHTWYDCEKKEWDRDEQLSQGQSMLSFADAIRVGRAQGRDTRKWEVFLRKACDFHAARILQDAWRPVSTDQAFFIAPLCAAHRLFGVPDYLRAAEKAGAVYAERHLSMREPYWGGTLDARCEDKEGAFAGLQGFLALHESTNKADYLDWARHAGDVVLTYTVLWDIDLPAGRLRDHAFKTRGWSVVSVQNQHIDVFGVLIAPYIYRLGQLTGRDDWMRLALLMYRSCGQLIDAQGSQGEQPQHTNYTQRGSVADVRGLRGDYVENWTVFWITAHFLHAGARFEEMGVSLWEKAAP